MVELSKSTAPMPSDTAGSTNENGSSSSIQFQGFVDHIAEKTIKGWVIAKPAQQDPVRVGLFIKGQLVDSSSATIYRDDLAQAKIQDGKVGFSLSFGTKDK